MSSFLFLAFAGPGAGDGDVWHNGPTEDGTILYSVITPIICVFGIIGNTLSILVLCKRDLSGSIFTYLGVLASTYLCMSVVFLLSGLSRGALWYDGWVIYDALIGLPLGGAINSLSVFATMAVTIDRVIYLWDPVACSRPKFCRPYIARRLMIICSLIAVAFNIPYCFIYTRMPDGRLVTTPFFDSRSYLIFNWIYLSIFAFIPAIILILGNGFLINSLQKAKAISQRARSKCRKKHHTSLTITLIAIIIMFLVSEIPANLVSRTTAICILYNGNHDEANSTTLEVLRQVCILINAMSLSGNFVFYYMFCPPFCKVLQKTFRFRRDVLKTKTLQVNVFVLDGKAFKRGNNRAMKEIVKDKIVAISRKSLDGNFSTNVFVKDFTENRDLNPPDCMNFSPNIKEENDYIDLDMGYARHSYIPSYSTITEESETCYTGRFDETAIMQSNE